MAATKKDFGEFARKARIAAGLALREAARQMDYSASYLSRVESGDETASPKLIAAMAKEYRVPLEKLTELAPQKRPGVHGHMLQGSPELRALYRLGAILDAEEVESVLRKLLAEKLNLQGDDLEQELRDLKNELPRLRKGTEGLFAADVRPRILTRNRIRELAEGFLRKHGLTRETYHPPTPIERLVELESDIRLRVRDDLDRKKHGGPYVLGLSRWDSDGNKEIAINSGLAEREDETSEYRMLFTIGHELFHALDHLPLMNAAARLRTECCRAVLDVNSISLSDGTAAQRAVESWRRGASNARRLSTPEDWREWQSQTFSAEILMPKWAVEREFQKRAGTPVKASDSANPKDVAFVLATQTVFESSVFDNSLNQLFKVSAQAMAIRLLTLNLVS